MKYHADSLTGSHIFVLVYFHALMFYLLFLIKIEILKIPLFLSNSGSEGATDHRQ